jgi:hypothetical protein
MVRGFLVAAVCAAVVLIGAGCGSDSMEIDPESVVTPSGEPTGKVCADAKALSAELTTKVNALVTRAAQESAAGNTALAEQTLQGIVPLGQEYSLRFGGLAKATTDQRLRDAFKVVAADLGNARAETAGEVAAQLGETLTAVCGE